MAIPQQHDLSDIRALVDLTGVERRNFETSCRWRRFVAGEQILDQMDENAAPAAPAALDNPDFTSPPRQ